jgi:hypothetical protein
MHNQRFVKNLPLKGVGVGVKSGTALGAHSNLPPHPNRSPRLRRRRGASLTAPLPPPWGEGVILDRCSRWHILYIRSELLGG